MAAKKADKHARENASLERALKRAKWVHEGYRLWRADDVKGTAYFAVAGNQAALVESVRECVVSVAKTMIHGVLYIDNKGFHMARAIQTEDWSTKELVQVDSATLKRLEDVLRYSYRMPTFQFPLRLR